MSKKGKKSSNKRGKGVGKTTKQQVIKHPKTEQSTSQEDVQPLDLSSDRTDRTEMTGTELEKEKSVQEGLEQVNVAKSDQIMSQASESGTSALPNVSENSRTTLPRHPEAGPSTSPRDLGAGPSTSRDSGAGPSTSRDSGAGPSTSRDLGAGPSTSRDLGAGPSTSRDWGAGPSTSRDYGAGPSTSQGTGADTRYIASDIPERFMDENDLDNLKCEIISKFLGIPQSLSKESPPVAVEKLTELQKYEVEEQDIHRNQHENGNVEVASTSQAREIKPCEFKIPASKVKRKIPASDENASTSKEDSQVSTTFLDKHNSDQICQISSSISEKAPASLQECVVTSSDVDTLVEGVQRWEISTKDIKLDIRNVQEIEREMLQMDIARESNNSPDFEMKQYIGKLAASLMELDLPIVLDEYYRPHPLTRKKTRVPYVFLHPPFDFRNHIKNVLQRNIQIYVPKRGTHYTKILGPTFEDQQKLVQYFDEYRMPYHTFGPPSQKMMRVVIRGLTGEIDLDKLKKELIAVSIPVERVHKMRFRSMRKIKNHVILAIVPYSAEGLKLLQVRKIFGQIVTMEAAKSKTKQCHRCQRWGHAQRYCQGRVKCVKCAGDHFSDQCQRNPDEEPPSCANCGGDHTASYRQCFHCPDSPVYKMWQTRKKINKFPQILATVENCEALYAHDPKESMSTD